jgi:E3 ubiquitin-protein ligase RNF31
LEIPPRNDDNDDNDDDYKTPPEEATPLSPPSQNQADMNRLAEELQYKYNREIEHFRKMSRKEQSEYLDDKRSHKETITHLTPYYQGNDLHLPQHARERRREEEDITFDEQAVDRDLERREKERRQQKQKEDGQYFVQCIKLCAEYNFDPKEVEIALKFNRDDPLEFLMTEWLQRIDNLQKYVKFKCKVGEPSQNESRLLLIETKGNYKKAGDLCIQRRKEKIEELASKVKGKFEVEEDDLIQTLSACQLDVMEAFYALQCHRLNDVYEYLKSDYKKITQGKPEMDFMKAFILEKIKDKDKEEQFKVQY